MIGDGAMTAAGRAVRRHALWWLGAGALAISIVFLVRAMDLDALAATWRAALAHPVVIAVVIASYLAAFVVRAMMWTAVLPELPVSQALAAIHLSLGGNHVLPLRLGEALRVTSVVRRTITIKR